MTQASSILHTLVAHTAWANRQLFGALHAVEAFEARSGADLIKRALDHIHVVRCIFQAHLQGVPHGFAAPQRAACPSLDALDVECEAIDHWYIDLVAAMPAEELGRAREVRFTDGKLVTMTAADMLLHVVTHTVHHRGNIDVIMLQTGMPRRRDGIPEYVSRASAT